MGTTRQKAGRLPEKLLQVRLALGISQTEMLKRLDVEDMIVYNRISDYELGKREPPLPILLKYARIAGVWVDVLIDDELDLPEELPSPTKHEGIRRKPGSRKRKR
jgi:transcriptional regulator with XRE-family HTH domain